jgi:hypothetical protein
VHGEPYTARIRRLDSPRYSTSFVNWMLASSS